MVQLSLSNRNETLPTYIGRFQRVKNAHVPRRARVIVVFSMEVGVVVIHKWIKGTMSCPFFGSAGSSNLL